MAMLAKRRRVALAERLTRMNADTLRDYLADEEAEIRRAAALATAAKKNRSHTPALVRLLSDADADVRRAAEHALKALTGKNFGSDAAAWQKWWRTNSVE